MRTGLPVTIAGLALLVATQLLWSWLARQPAPRIAVDTTPLRATAPHLPAPAPALEHAALPSTPRPGAAPRACLTTGWTLEQALDAIEACEAPVRFPEPLRPALVEALLRREQLGRCQRQALRRALGREDLLSRSPADLRALVHHLDDDLAPLLAFVEPTEPALHRTLLALMEGWLPPPRVARQALEVLVVHGPHPEAEDAALQICEQVPVEQHTEYYLEVVWPVLEGQATEAWVPTLEVALQGSRSLTGLTACVQSLLRIWQREGSCRAREALQGFAREARGRFLGPHRTVEDELAYTTALGATLYLEPTLELTDALGYLLREPDPFLRRTGASYWSALLQQLPGDQQLAALETFLALIPPGEQALLEAFVSLTPPEHHPRLQELIASLPSSPGVRQLEVALQTREAARSEVLDLDQGLR